ncbi:CAP domain-containing protein [Acaryochloris sp. IP29b_bin.148]|uniref:CAP domain-containing protein n=1 Tax=Acaryochloris sp. IP29b_bin.148 TaxID=2969218 RepID=UPI00261A62EC|nr:CAP domain-containing protein [Acaryochloris sp. IP29b_bin.148]
MSYKQYSIPLIVFSIMSVGVVSSTVSLAHSEPSAHPQATSESQQTASKTSFRPAWSQEMLQAHNQWRQRTGIPPLTWSDKLANHAQAWANHLAHDNFKLYHRPNNPYGENLTWAAHQQLSPTQVVNMWGDEVQHYNYDTNQCSAVCGHYTQLVWQNTTEVGCANVRSGHQEIWVCNYNPPGNYRGQKPYQAVFKSDHSSKQAQNTVQPVLPTQPSRGLLPQHPL